MLTAEFCWRLSAKITFPYPRTKKQEVYSILNHVYFHCDNTKWSLGFHGNILEVRRYFHLRCVQTHFLFLKKKNSLVLDCRVWISSYSKWAYSVGCLLSESDLGWQPDGLQGPRHLSIVAHCHMPQDWLLRKKMSHLASCSPSQAWETACTGLRSHKLLYPWVNH